MRDTVVIIGVGGMGEACARRLGSGRHLVLAEHDSARVERFAEALAADGYSVSAHALDVSDRAAVHAFADAAGAAGRLGVLVHTAGLTPRNASADAIHRVNLLGAAHVFDAFLPLAAPGSVAFSLSSIAAFSAPIAPDLSRRLALDPHHKLMETVRLIEGWDTPGGAYWIAKRTVQLRAEADAIAWGARGGRVLSISPGVIATPMNRVPSAFSEHINQSGMNSPAGRLGTADDIAAAIEWLSGPAASYITGCDIRIDGGLVAAQVNGAVAAKPMTAMHGED